VIRKAGRWFNPTTLILAALCFSLPFVSVGCDTPDGYAGASPGGTSAYTGVTLVVGGAPKVTEGYERPVPAGESDRLPPQPALGAVLLAIVAAATAASVVSRSRTRRAAVTALTAVGATALVVGQALVQAELTVRVSDHLNRVALTGEQLDPAKPAHDYVHTGPGFTFCLALLLLVAALNAVGWHRARPRPALVVPAPAQDPWSS
jgi:hypothetical protein